MSISSYLALIIIVIVINALKSAQKKKEAEEARRMPTAKAQQPKQSAPKVHSQPTVPTPAPMPAHAHTTVHAAKPKVHEHLAAECENGNQYGLARSGKSICNASSDSIFDYTSDFNYICISSVIFKRYKKS